MQYMLRRWRKCNATALSVARTGLITGVAALCLTTNALAVILQVKDAPLKEVVMMLTQQSGVNIVIADESKLDRKVSANLNDVPLDKALMYIVKNAGVSFNKMADGTYIIGGSNDEPAVPSVDITSRLTPVDNPEPAPVYAPAQPSEYMITSIKLTHSKASELLRLLGWNGANPMPNSETYYPEMNPSSGREAANRGGLYLNSRDGTTYDTRQGIRMQNDVPAVPTIDPRELNPGAGRTGDISTGAAQFPNAGVGRPGYNPTQSTTRTTGTTSGTTGAQSSTSTNSNFLWPDGVVDAKPFDLDNSIIVKADEEGLEKFKKIVRMLDVPPKQVQIKAEFVEVKTTDVKRFGIDWSLERLNESFSTSFGPVGNVAVGFATGNLTAQLRTQLTSDVGRIINAPIISTINNQNAMISINTVIPYWVSIATVVGDGNVINQATPNFINVYTGLSVMPRVNGDGTITMIIQPQVADTGNIISGPEGSSDIPEQRQQMLFTQRRVANGETIVVGGFIRKNDSNSYQKVPILGDLPIIGSLFRTSAKTTEDRELLIFITATIIPDSGASAGASLIQ